MIPHPYVYEKMIASRHAQLQHDMHQSRMAYAGQRRTIVRSTVSILGTLMIVLGSHLQRTGQRSGASLHSS
jgi:hypothetical protein